MGIRKQSSTSYGYSFSQTTIDSVWNKATVIPGNNPAVRRKDSCGAWIEKSLYGFITENGAGWEIDHIVPVSRGGSDALSNRQPLQWQNNRHKGDDYPDWSCRIAA